MTKEDWKKYFQGFLIFLSLGCYGETLKSMEEGDDPETFSPLLIIPHELQEKIYGCLPTEDRGRLGLTCRELYDQILLDMKPCINYRGEWDLVRSHIISDFQRDTQVVLGGETYYSSLLLPLKGRKKEEIRKRLKDLKTSYGLNSSGAGDVASAFYRLSEIYKERIACPFNRLGFIESCLFSDCLGNPEGSQQIEALLSRHSFRPKDSGESDVSQWVPCLTYEGQEELIPKERVDRFKGYTRSISSYNSSLEKEPLVEQIGFLISGIDKQKEAGFAFYCLGDLYADLGHYDKALTCFHKGIPLKNESSFWRVVLMIGEGELSPFERTDPIFDDLDIIDFPEIKYKIGAVAFEKRLSWYRRAAEQGHVSAQYDLGVMLENKYSTGKNIKKEKDWDSVKKEAITWLLRAAKNSHVNALELLTKHQGEPDVCYELGMMYAQGQGVQKNLGQAVEWLRKAAALGCPRSQHNLGVIFSEGTKGIERNLEEAMSWFWRAAEQGRREDSLNKLKENATAGVREAQYTLGMMILNGRVLPQDTQEGMAWIQKAAEQEYGIAQYELGSWIERQYTKEGKNTMPEEAMRWFLKSAKNGYPNALKLLERVKVKEGSCVYKDPSIYHELGMMYAQGQGVRKNLGQATEWFRKAAALGCPRSQHNLGVLLSRDRWGVKKNLEEAVKWFRVAAEQGDVDSLNKLRKKAEAGIREAQYALGEMFEQGLGVQKDLEESKKWLKKSAEGKKGDPIKRVTEEEQIREVLEKSLFDHADSSFDFFERANGVNF